LVAQLKKTFGNIFEVMNIASIENTNNILKDSGGTGCQPNKINQQKR